MTLIDKAEALLPCPFCGGGATFSEGKTGDGKPWHYVECSDCGAMGPSVSYADHNIAVKSALADAWNRRAMPAVMPKVKPLVWGEDRDADSEDFGAFVARSPTVHLRYIVRKVYGGGWKLTGSVPFGQPTIDTLEAAQAAAQADYEARILAALTTEERK